MSSFLLSLLPSSASPSTPDGCSRHRFCKPQLLSDIPARNSQTNTSLVQMLLTSSRCFWKGKRFLDFAAQMVTEDPDQKGEGEWMA